MQVIHDKGIVFIDRASDEWFRRMLKEGGPTQAIRAKFAAALNGRHPHADARQFSERHFGADNLKRIALHCDPLIQALDAWYERQGRRGLTEWLNQTGWGNDYKLIMAFEAWADNVTGKGESHGKESPLQTTEPPADGGGAPRSIIVP